MDTPTAENPPPSPAQSSKLKTITKWAMIVSSLLLILLITTALLLTYFFPSELVRKELEVQGSESLQGTVRIDSLSFNLLTGLELKKVDFSQQGNQILQLKRLNLDYSFLALLRGKLKINEILFEHADVSLNLPEMTEAKLPQEDLPLPATASRTTTIPSIPVSINLHSLAIRDSNLHLVVSPTLTMTLTTLDTDISGEADEHEAALDGKIRIENLAISTDNRHLRLPLGIDFSIDTNLSDQHLNLEQLTIQSDSHVQLNLSGQLEQYFDNPDIDVSLQDTRLDLDKILILIKDFLPPEVTTMTIAGILSPTVRIKGRIDDSGFRGKINATVNAQKLVADVPQFSTQVADTDLSLVISNLSIEENTPDLGKVAFNLSTQQIEYDKYLLRNFTLSASTDYFAAGTVLGKIKTTGTSLIPAVGQFQAMTLPFDIHLDAKGNHKTQNVTINDLAVILKDYITLQAQGGFHPHALPSQSSKVFLDARISPRLNNILPLVPKKFLEGVTIAKGTGSDVVKINVTGTLKADYTPQWANASSTITLTNLTANLHTLPAHGLITNMNVFLSTGYNATSGQIGGTVGIAIQASDLQQSNAMSVETTDLKLKSTFLGHTTPTWELTNFRSQEKLRVALGNIAYESPSLQAVLDQVTVSARTKEDIFKKDFVIEHLGIKSDQLLDMSMKGQYRMDKQQFSIRAEMPLLKVGNILNRLSGDLVESVNEMRPSGTMSLSLQASGQVPKPVDIDSLALPINANISLTLQDIGGAFAGHQIRGTNGTFGASHTPGDQPTVKIASDLRVSDIRLAQELPITHLSQALASFNVSFEDFNDIRLNEMRLGIAGADLSAQGTVTGIKDLVYGNSDLGPVMKDLFAKIQTKASVDVSNFQDLLKQFEIKGSGQSEIDLSLSKKKRGPLNVKLNLGTESMNLAQGTTRVTNLDGRLKLQKRLAWNDENMTSSLPESFNPTNVLAHLRSITNKQKSLKIDRIDLGDLSISNFSTHILFDGKAFKIQNLAMNLLGGGLGGDIVLTTGKAFGISASIEAARLDLNNLLTDDLKISGNSLVDATIRTSIFFEEETKTLDMRRTEMNLFITHIGQEAVDRLLVFLDPEGSNPTLVSARSQVRLANPSNVTMKMGRGMLSLEILFSEGLLPPFRLDRFPIGRLKNLQTVTQEIPNWEMITKMMALIGAQTYGVDENGNLLIQ